MLNIEKTKYLIMSNKINILNNSSYYKTPSWPNPKLPKFINIAIKVQTYLSLPKLFIMLRKN